MQILRKKGDSLPIQIQIKIKYPAQTYSLNKKEYDFEQIKEFLFNVKTDFIKQLDSAYKEKYYLRFLHGKLFRAIIKHFDNRYNISDILRFILNKIENKESIKEGKIYNEKSADDYVTQYHKYNEKSFENISNYFISLFENNDTSLERHYESMLINEKERNKYKGIYLQNCKNKSMEEFILEIFQDKIEQLPIAQNILFCNKETSLEEIQSFLYRAFLCDYNTLFVIEINDSFSDFQYNIMYSYIDALLLYKLEKYKDEKNNNNISKDKTNIYLDACIIFVYEENNFNNTIESFIRDRHIEKQIFKHKNKNKNNDSKNNESNINESFNEYSIKEDLNLTSTIRDENSLISIKNEMLEKVRVITSDICGLGKSFKIKKMIDKKKM